jgi:teichuronic acid biosynthesis glycosyltransferase TuaC
LPLLRAARDIDRSLPLHLIHAHTAYPDGFAAVRVGRALKLPVVVTLHGGDVNVHFQRYLWRRLGLWALSRADRVIAVSESLRRKVVEEYRMSAAKVTVIPNGVDVTRFQPMTRAEALRGLELDSHAARVLYVGAINESKGIRYLLKAANRVTESLHRAIEFVLIGEGEYEEGARTLTRELGIASAVNFVGKRPNSEIPLWINASDLLVLPSLSEGFGVALIEAMACGKPVVATRCGGPDDIVRPDTGILVPPGDEAALAEALREILSGERQFDPQRVRQRALDNYAYDGVVSRILEVYRKAVQG